MKIHSSDKKSSYWDDLWTRGKTPAPVSPKAVEPAPIDPPKKAPEDYHIRQRNPEIISNNFVGRKNWPTELQISYATAKLSEEQRPFIETTINDIIKTSVVQACERTNLNYLPWEQIPGKLVSSMKDIIEESLKTFVGRIFGVQAGFADNVAKEAETALSSILPNLVKTIKEFGIHNELSWRFNRQQEAFEELEKKQNAPVSSININLVQKALMNRKKKFDDMIDKALAAYSNGQRTLANSPGMLPEEAFQELSQILGETFRTSLKFKED